MAETGRVGFCIDEALGKSLAPMLRRLRAPGTPVIRDVWDEDLVGTSDEVLLSTLGQRGFAALVTRDSRMLSAAARRAVWRNSRVSVFMADGKFGNLSIFEQARRLFWWWPTIVQQGQAGPQGGAWRIAADLVPSGMRQVFADRGEQEEIG
jgi:hypothetical protein